MGCSVIASWCATRAGNPSRKVVRCNPVLQRGAPSESGLDPGTDLLAPSPPVSSAWDADHGDVPAALRRARVGIVDLDEMPKFRNNISCKAFQYMASGMPVVGSDLPPQHLFIEHGVNGLFFEPDSHHALAAAVRRLLADPFRPGRSTESMLLISATRLGREATMKGTALRLQLLCAPASPASPRPPRQERRRPPRPQP